MVTLVGTQTDFADVLKDLVELDYDAVEAYQAAINRINNHTYKLKLAEFKADHERHIKELTDVLINHGERLPKGPSIGKQWLTKGKVVIATLMGDDAILLAMKSNEGDTNTAYERVNSREDKWPDSRDIIKRGLDDERRHKAWLESYSED